MPTDKPKRKNTPRSRRLLGAAVIVVLLVFGGLVAFPYVETRLNQWLENDPFTPMCDAPHLELAYERDEADSRDTTLYRIRGDGSNKVALTQETSDSIRYEPDWSPDGQWLLLGKDGPSMIYYPELINRASGEMTHLNTVWTRPPDWSPDGRYLVDWNDAYGYYTWRLSYPSQPDTYIYQARSHTMPRWSPDGSQIILSETSSEQQEIIETVLIDTKDDFERHVVYNGSRRLMGWSPDGTFFAFVAEGKLWLVEFDVASRQFTNTQTIPLDIYIDWISWSPDNQTLALISVSNGYRTIFIDRESGDSIWEIGGLFPDSWLNANVVRLKNDSNPNNPSWVYGYLETQSLEPISAAIENDGLPLVRYETRLSSDLAYLIYATASYSSENRTVRLYIADSDGQQRQLLTTQPIEYEFQRFYQFTPDEQYLSYEGENSWLYLLNLETRSVCRVVKGNSLRATNYDWRLIPEGAGGEFSTQH